MFQQVSQWRSFDYPYLPDTVEGLCNKLLDILEAKHGQLITSHVLSILTCSLYGLSEAEIEDILSIDDEVSTSVTQLELVLTHLIVTVCIS